MKSLPSRKLRISLIICDLFTNVSLTSGFTIRSTYLCLYLWSVLVRPWYFSGSTWRLLVRRVISDTWIDISPFCVRNTSPLTPTISPISNFLNAAYGSSPTQSLATYSWILSLRSATLQNEAFPITLFCISLPAMETSLPSSSSKLFLISLV